MTDETDTPWDVRAVHSDIDEMDLKAIQEHWSYLYEEEHRAFEASVKLDNDNSDKTPEKAEAVRHWWMVASALTRFFVQVRLKKELELQPFPAYALTRLSNISEELGVGNVPTFVTDGRKAGRVLWRGERRHIAHAVFYIEAAKRGEIQDRSYNKTVREAFRVSAKAVQGWLKQRDKICVGLPYKHLTPAMIQRKMQESGAIYARIGRGAPES